MKRGLLIGCLLLAGCDKENKPDPSAGFMHLGMSRDVRAAGSLNVMIMGQSNAAFMNPDGDHAFQASMPMVTNIVNCAVGGTKIPLWESHGTLFQACFQQMPKPDAILWYQGEGDAEWDGIPETWAQQFTAIATAIRQRAGDIPIVYAQIANDPPPTQWYPAGTFLYWSQIQAQQAQVSISRSKMITTGDIPMRYDYVHFTSDGYKTLGTRFADALKQLLQGGK